MSIVAQIKADGYSRTIIADADMYTLELLVKPDADLGDRFKAYDVDSDEWINVNGWLFTCEDAE